MGLHTLGCLDNRAPADVDTADLLQLPFLEAQSGQTQESWSKGPDSCDQPLEQGPQGLCPEAGSMEVPLPR